MDADAGPIVYLARLRARDGESDIIAAALVEMAEAVREREPGCLVYAVHRQVADPASFLIYEVYADGDAFRLHRGSPHLREIVEARVAPRLELREGDLYRPLGLRAGGSIGA